MLLKGLEMEDKKRIQGSIFFGRAFKMAALVLLLCFPVNAFADSAVTNQKKRDVPSQSLAGLLKDLNSPDPSTASNAISELKTVKINPQDALPALIAALGNQSEFVRLGVINAIADFGHEGLPALQALKGALKDKDPLVRESAALAIMGLGVAAKKSIPDLAGLLNDGSKKTRDAAVTALAGFGADSVPVLIKSLESGSPLVSKSAAEALARIGAPAVDQLVSSLKKGGITAENASFALAAIGKPAVAPLIRLLKDANPEVSRIAGDTLAAMGAIATPGLVDALRSRN